MRTHIVRVQAGWTFGCHYIRLAYRPEPPNSGSTLGYRWHHSTETAVLIVHNDIIRAIDKGKLTVMMFFDLGFAFDTTSRSWQHFVYPSLSFTVEGVALKWFQCFTRTWPIARIRYPLATASRVIIEWAAVFHKDQCSGLWNSWPTLRALMNCLIGFEVNHHLYAGDQQIYLHTEPWLPHAWRVYSWPPACPTCPSDGAHLDGYTANAAKTELIWFGSWSMLRRLTGDNPAHQLAPR